MPSDFISLFSGDLDLNAPRSLYSKGNTNTSYRVNILSCLSVYFVVVVNESVCNLST